MSGDAAIHHPLRYIESGSSHVDPVVNITDLADRAAVNSPSTSVAASHHHNSTVAGREQITLATLSTETNISRPRVGMAGDTLGHQADAIARGPSFRNNRGFRSHPSRLAEPSARYPAMRIGARRRTRFPP